MIIYITKGFHTKWGTFQSTGFSYKWGTFQSTGFSYEWGTFQSTGFSQNSYYDIKTIFHLELLDFNYNR